MALRLKPEPETRLEFIRLVIVLTLALLALMATARQQVMNLSFLEAVGAVDRTRLRCRHDQESDRKWFVEQLILG